MKQPSSALKRLTRSLVVATGLAAGSVGAHAADTINFGIISTESSQNLRTIWDPFLEAMKAQTGLEVKPFFASDYAGVIEGMRFGKVDVAWYGNKSAMEAVDRANGEVFAQTVDSEGNPGYWSLLITAQGQPAQRSRGRTRLRQVAELRARRSELDLGLPRSDHIHLRTAWHRPEDLLQARHQRQPREQPALGREPEGRLRDQQHREPAPHPEDEPEGGRQDQGDMALSTHPVRPAGLARRPR